MKSVVRNWRDPTCHRKVKDDVYKLGEVTIMTGGSRERFPASFMFVERVRVRECHGVMQTNNSKEKVRQLQNKLYLTVKKCSSRR